MALMRTKYQHILWALSGSSHSREWSEESFFSHDTGGSVWQKKWHAVKIPIRLKHRIKPCMLHNWKDISHHPSAHSSFNVLAQTQATVDQVRAKNIRKLIFCDSTTRNTSVCVLRHSSLTKLYTKNILLFFTILLWNVEVKICVFIIIIPEAAVAQW